MKKTRYSVILGNLGNTCDRYLSSGYKDNLPKEEMIRQAATIDGVQGLELVGSWDITRKNVKEVQALLVGNGLECVSIIPDFFSHKQWGSGSFCAKDPTIRRLSLEEARTAARIAREMSCPLVNFWLGQDGYDYPMQADYMTERKWMAEGLATVASEFSDLRFAFEYKPREPRNRSYHARAADTLLMVQEIGLPNVGVCIDVGHALMAGENVAESAVMLHHYGDKLFHMHFNDNYRAWDDDMIVGSLHFVEYVELLFWLREIGYNGWYSMDQYPYREDGMRAVRESVRFLQGVEKLLTPENMAAMRALVAKGDATESTAFFRELIMPTHKG
ncbi:sugar phosphate isomerase/epimerase [Termitidicoccus mucosus]|uniref:Xylose isomerase n=1 Tax=Termitidicoccus mucosus TaxID=1184151 RepID=A0A178ICF1_9BACT|nr:xylose isomerase [Opitutaceae bacterium TSB47]